MPASNPLVNSYFIGCPYCLEQFEVIVDATAGNQEYTEDCEVCCNPVVLKITMNDDGVSGIEAFRENG